MSTGLIVAIVAVIVILIVGYLIVMIRRGLKRMEALKKQTLARADQATAEVLRLANSGRMQESGAVRRLGVRLELNVRHPGRGTYQASTVWLVDEIVIPQVQPGKELPVLVNADDPTRVYPNIEGAEFDDWTLKKL